MPSKKQVVVAAYIPVLHRGYIEFLQKQKPTTIYLFDTELLQLVDYIRKDLRAVDPPLMQLILTQSLEAMQLPQTTVEVISAAQLADLASQGLNWVLPNEDIAHEVAKKYLGHASVTYKPVFLRWDRANTAAKDEATKSTTKPADIKRMKIAYQQASRSSDIWRRVGAAVFDSKGGLLYAATNMPATTQHSPWMEGDPRNAFNKGVGIEMSSFFHAEASVIAQAAREGKSLKGTSIYATTFPCPPCAMLIANSGIKSCYYAEGYAVLDGEKIMASAGVTVHKIAITPPKIDPDELVTYKKSKP